MPLHLSEQQISDFNERGYCAPVDIMSEQDALALAAELEDMERQYPDAFEGRNRNNAHLVFSFLDRIAFNESILDVVQDLIGPDILLWGTVMFIKEPESRGYVSWHQDATYMGITPHEFVTPWLALSPSNPESGCMSVIPGSHLAGIHDHDDTFAEDNILTRGQNIEDVDESQAVDLILRPGQISVHHSRLIHGSRPNRSSHRRIGVALQAYLTPNVKPEAGVGHVIPCRGTDQYQHHQLLSRPEGNMTAEGIRQRDMVNDNWNDILYRGASQRRNY